jgi:chemotaxis protein MotB
MARMHQWIGLTVISFSLVGCVSQEKYNAMKLDRDQLAERLGVAEGQLQGASADADAQKSFRDKLLGSANNQNALVTNLTQQNAQLQAQYDALNKQYQEALNRPTGSVALPQELNNALEQYAQQNPDLVEFDSARGIVKFRSDITFAVGTSELNDRARTGINRFAEILNSPTAANYELQVAGHTDNQRVQNPRTISAGHKDNWFLSAHRAIAVSEAMQHDGVAPNRLAVVGYADQHPIADNNSEAGRAANRRVEVLILPTTVHSAIVRSSRPTNNVARRPQAPRNNELNKDTVGNDQRPVFNK